MDKTLSKREVIVGNALFEFKGHLPTVIVPRFSSITVKYPSRIEAISLDESKIALETEDNIYTAGQIDFCVDICNLITVRLRQDGNICIKHDFERGSLVKHAAILLQKALKITNGFDIEIKQDLSLQHCGLGSSSAIIQGVGAAINELYGNPIARLDLIRYLCSNHGEESDKENVLVQVQSVGGSGICGHFEGGLIINAGKATPIFRKNLPEDFSVVLGIPAFYEKNTSEKMMSAELDNLTPFIVSGQKYAKDIAFRLVNEVMPSLVNDDFKPCKDLIFDVRYSMGSNQNCAFYYHHILEIAEKLHYLKDDPEIEFMSLATVGPAFFMITKKPEKAERIFQELQMTTYRAKVYNNKYHVLNRQALI